MKIIDILNKIANGEEAPKKMKYNGKIYNYEDSDYFASNYGYLFDRYNVLRILNDEVEIIEEKKILEKDKEIERLKNNWNKLKDFINRNCFYDEDTLSYEELITEINLIEYGSDNK